MLIEKEVLWLEVPMAYSACVAVLDYEEALDMLQSPHMLCMHTLTSLHKLSEVEPCRILWKLAYTDNLVE